MVYTRISEVARNVCGKAIKSSPLIVLLLIAMFTATTPAHAQNSDAWKSVAIIGGSTAAGAYIGNKIGGGRGALIGAAVGATAGYAIDRHRRQSEYNNDYGYNNGGYYGDNGGYYGNGDPYPGDGGYYRGNAPPYGSGYRNNYERRR
jgi:hypothetical protein